MTSPVQDVGVDHGRRDILVAQELLDGSDIVTGFEQMRGKGMAKRVASCTLDDSGFSHGFLGWQEEAGSNREPGRTGRGAGWSAWHGDQPRIWPTRRAGGKRQPVTSDSKRARRADLTIAGTTVGSRRMVSRRSDSPRSRLRQGRASVFPRHFRSVATDFARKRSHGEGAETTPTARTPCDHR